jgi:hypothetical protein
MLSACYLELTQAYFSLCMAHLLLLHEAVNLDCCLASLDTSRYACLLLVNDSAVNPFLHQPTELKNPKEVIEEFRHAAKQAKRAGFDGVERRHCRFDLIFALY